MTGIADLKAAIAEGAVDRVRPKLMTVATTLFGLLPIMVSTETGTRVMKLSVSSGESTPRVSGRYTFLTLSSARF